MQTEGSQGTYNYQEKFDINEILTT